MQQPVLRHPKSLQEPLLRSERRPVRQTCAAGRSPAGVDGCDDMNREFPEELLSAYLDDRVTADERLRVHQALAESAELRELHADLQRARSGLQRLPRFSLPADFADRVVQRIEHESQERGAASPVMATPAAVGRSARAGWRSWKSQAAVAASLAAVLLLSLLWLSDRHPLPDTERPIPSVASSERAPQSPEPRVGTERALPDGSHLIAGMDEFQSPGPTYVFIMDLALTPEGQRQQVFRQALQAAGIQFNPAVAVDEVLEKALLASRFIGDVEIAEPKSLSDKRPARDEIEMYYVTGLGDQMEAAIADLRTRPKEHIAQQRFDMAIEPAERKLFEQLNSAVRLADARKVPPTPQAYRLALRSGSAGFLGSFSRPLIAAEAVPVEKQAAVPLAASGTAERVPELPPAPAGPMAAASSPTPGGFADPDDDAHTVYEVLFILRNLR